MAAFNQGLDTMAYGASMDLCLSSEDGTGGLG